MGINTNIGQQSALVVYGNPESFKKLIMNHGQLCKIRQAVPCPCAGDNNGSPDMYCAVCRGKGYVYTYQRRFFVSDEQPPSCGKSIFPFWQPVLEVVRVQHVTSPVQGGISELTVKSFTGSEIVVKEDVPDYEKKRISYFFDGWTEIIKDELNVMRDLKIMYCPGTRYNAEYQSSNPLDAFRDIASVSKVYHEDGTEIKNFTFSSNYIAIGDDETIKDGKYYADYHVADMGLVITNDIANTDNLEKWTNELKSGECRMAFFPWWNFAKGDIIILAATVLYKNQILTHIGTHDELWELEPYDLNETILDSTGKAYNIGIDYVLRGRYIEWLTDNRPEDGKSISVRYGYKPAYIVFENNPQPNNLENKQYPKLVYAKSWSKITDSDVLTLLGERN
jgi:hypothetical protein